MKSPYNHFFLLYVQLLGDSTWKLRCMLVPPNRAGSTWLRKKRVACCLVGETRSSIPHQETKGFNREIIKYRNGVVPFDLLVDRSGPRKQTYWAPFSNRFG